MEEAEARGSRAAAEAVTVHLRLGAVPAAASPARLQTHLPASRTANSSPESHQQPSISLSVRLQSHQSQQPPQTPFTSWAGQWGGCE